MFRENISNKKKHVSVGINCNKQNYNLAHQFFLSKYIHDKIVTRELLTCS